MSKSKCPLCGKTLKGGEWMFKLINGVVVKICVDQKQCKQRQKEK